MVLRLRMVVPFFRRRDALGRHVLLHSQESSSRRSGRPSDGPGGGKKTLFSSSECTRLRFRYRISISSEITFLMGGLTMSESFCGVDGTGVVVACSLMVMVSMLGMILRWFVIGARGVDMLEVDAFARLLEDDDSWLSIATKLVNNGSSILVLSCVILDWCLICASLLLRCVFLCGSFLCRIAEATRHSVAAM